ncbi:MAG: VOC family protein, partial [Actinomycetes bacterium]
MDLAEEPTALRGWRRHETSGHRKGTDEDLALRPPCGRSRAVARVLHRRGLRSGRKRPRNRVRAADHAEAPRRRLRHIELAHDPTNGAADLGTGLNHFVIKVESMEATITELAANGIDIEAPESPDGSDDFLTSWITDPDGN